jgi:hypothetical protein
VTVPQLHAPDSDPPKALLAGAKSKPSIPLSGREVIWKSLVKSQQVPFDLGAVFQPWILAGEQSGLLTRTATTEGGSLCTPTKY